MNLHPDVVVCGKRANVGILAGLEVLEEDFLALAGPEECRVRDDLIIERLRNISRGPRSHRSPTVSGAVATELTDDQIVAHTSLRAVLRAGRRLVPRRLPALRPSLRSLFLVAGCSRH